MATKIAKDEKKTEGGKSPKEGGPRMSLDLKWLFAALGLAVIVFSSAIVGVKLAVDHIANQTKTVTQFVKEIPPKAGPIFPVVTDQVVNLNGGRFLRFSAAIQFAQDDVLFKEEKGEGKHESPIAKYDAILKDAIVTVASKHSANSLLDTAGKEKLKEELKAAINSEFKAMNEGREEAEVKAHPVPVVYKVFFPSFVIS